jgi:hypothetical protein
MIGSVVPSSLTRRPMTDRLRDRRTGSIGDTVFGERETQQPGSGSSRVSSVVAPAPNTPRRW